MRIEGTISKWNDDRGFGFITPSQGGQEIFVHISIFPRDGMRPAIGEKVSFEIETDKDGKKRAKNLLCPERPSSQRRSTSPSRRPDSYHRNERTGFLTRVIPLIVLAGLVTYGYSEFSRITTPVVENAASPEIDATSQSYNCDGRTHCSQMTSCEEATFFIRNCPGVEMDGNNDGVPCEQQWCTSASAK